MADRKSIGKRQRFKIFKRDGFTCQYCGGTPPSVVLVIDHILAVASGGETVDHNLITACEACNSGKSDKSLADAPRAIGEQLAEQVERREQLEQYNLFLMEARNREQEEVAAIGRYWFNRLCKQKDHWTFQGAREASIRTFLRKLPAAEVYDAVDIALSRIPASRTDDAKAWKYFCGVCWKKVSDRNR